jgi:hypothetical protein
MTAAPAWMGLTVDHLIEDCPHRARSRPTLERHGLWKPTLWPVNPGGTDLCGWCVRVWHARNRKATK